MSNVVDKETVSELADIESLTGDHTVGVLRAPEDDQIEGGTKFDVRRLRRLLLAYEEVFDARYAYLSLKTTEKIDGPLLALQESNPGRRAVIAANCHDPKETDDGGEDGDQA